MIYIHTTDTEPYKMQIRAEIITSWQLIGNNIVIEFKGSGTNKSKKAITHIWTWQKPIDKISNWPAVHTFLIGLNFKALEKLPIKQPTQETLF